MSSPPSPNAIAEAEVTNIGVIKNRPLFSHHLDIGYPSRMPFYLYGSKREMHIDHVLVQAPNAQLSAGELSLELIEGSESAIAEGLKDGLIAVADSLPEHLMRPFTSDQLDAFFHPCAKLDVSIYPDEEATQSHGYDLCDNPGEPIGRARITLGDNTFVDVDMINLDTATLIPQSPKKSVPGYFPEATFTVQDHPLFLGYVPGGTTTDHDHSLTTGSTQSWRTVWDRALASRQFADFPFNPNTKSDDSSQVP
jgi:hypothetical protein